MLILVSVPLLVAVVVSTFLLASELRRYTDAHRTAGMKDLISSMSALIHEQQKERGATSVFLSSGGQQFGPELSAQRNLTDQAASVVLSGIDLHGQVGGPEISAYLADVASVLSKRDGVRQLVDQLDIATPDALGHYTAHNATMLTTIVSIGYLSDSTRVAQKVASLEALLAAKEFSGIERAIGSGGFAAGAFDFQRLRLMERLITRQNDNLARFETIAEGGFKAAVAAIGKLDETQEIVRLRGVAFSSFETGDLQNVTAADYFGLTTVRIDAFKDVEDRLVADISASAKEIARSSLIVVLLLAGGVLFAAATAAWTTTYVVRNMTKEVRRISDAGDRLSQGDETAELPQDCPKELGRIVWSINSFKESVAAAKEREREELERKKKAKREAREEDQKLQEQERQRTEREAFEAKEQQERMQAYAAEVSAIVAACAQGDFTKKIDIAGKDGVFGEICRDLNTLVQAVDDGLSAAGGALERVANGDLTRPMQGHFNGAFADLQRNTNAMIGSLSALIGAIDGSTENLSTSSMELRDTSQGLSKQAEQNAASLEQTSAALEQLAANISQVNENVVEANNNATVAKDTAQESGTIASDAAQAMTKIAEASKEIAGVVTAINDISFQINLLALNAGVEAARAGDAGRGFSVVASEVRQLAQKAGEAATEIEEVISRSDVAVSEGVTKVQNTQRSFEKISESVIGISDRIEHVAHAISEQVTGIGEITSAVSQIDGNTQKQAASFEEVTAASALLSNEAEGLTRSISQFNTGAAPQAVEAAPHAQAARASHGGTHMAGAGNLALAADQEAWKEL
ncbi:MAG: methyl-accepting chemotaxis protein [Pseudomonadota bacterium]